MDFFILINSFFCYFSFNITMIELRENEEVWTIKRRHPVVLAISLIPVSLFLIITILLMFLVCCINIDIPEMIINIIPGDDIVLTVLYILSLSLIILWQISVVVFVNYYLDCWIITNERTISTELKTLFSRNVSSISHNRIQDITVEVKGFLQTFLNYGNLQIQTAGKFHEFIFKEIPEPYKTKELIFKAQKEFRKSRDFN
ncbi:MAG: PH domain-containing protein [Candidatus Pacebacteria bacterium]|nr:PH domain-containing protein [Candidatus Paceibacterota bacterium]